ncbi:hypothetical protein FXO37_31857 [Capsicum annuum]|nr:hypothetical protein FXO37_31857 [Capsicum annuum]
MEKATVQERGGIICISEGVSSSQNELFSRSVVDSLLGEVADTPTLSDCRHWVSSTWVSSTWKRVHEVNIYRMGKNQFLFEFPSKTTAEYILRGNWSWKLHRLRLQWWSPTVESTPCSAAIEQVWIRLVGLPLHLGSPNVFKEVGDYCRGWIRTEEETQLRNHLKWGRILVRGNADTIPKTINIEHKGINFSIQIWCELTAKFSPCEGSRERTSDHRLIMGSSSTEGGAREDSILTGHVAPDDMELSIVRETLVEDVVPISIHTEEPEQDPDFDILIWIHQNIIKIGKQFGIDFQGFEEEAQHLLMKIDQKKQS